MGLCVTGKYLLHQLVIVALSRLLEKSLELFSKLSFGVWKLGFAIQVQFKLFSCGKRF